MKRWTAIFLVAVIVSASFTGCIGWRFAPGFSAKDTRYFAAPPRVVQKDSGNVLAWTYGDGAFPFIPSYRVREGRLIFALQATSSAWPVSGRYQEMDITGAEAAAAILAGEVYWWEPDRSLLPLEIVAEE